jgi:UDP-glucose 4-epimerase
LITGGAGFVGSHLAERLLRDGHAVTALDNLSTGSIENVASFRRHPRFRLVVASVMERPVVAELVDEADVIFHLAAAVGVRLIVESPVATIATNVRGTEILLQLAAKKRKRLLLTSTSEVYGKSGKIPFREGQDLVLGPPDKARWSYGCSKALDEFMALAYWRERKVPVTIARLFNTVGPRQTGRYGMVVPTFVGQALRGEPITVYGDGRQTRCFCHVRDVTEALVGLAACEAAAGEIFNVGSREEISIGDLALLVKEMTGSPSPIVHVPYEEAYGEGFEDMRRRVPDVSKLERWIGFRPRAGIREILRDVIEDLRTRLEDRGAQHRRSLAAAG